MRTLDPRKNVMDPPGREMLGRLVEEHGIFAILEELEDLCIDQARSPDVPEKTREYWKSRGDLLRDLIREW
jgi:hypothetical protein